MMQIEKHRKRIILVISLFILLLQLVINHFYGGITLKSLIVILIGWGISIGMLMLALSSVCKK